MHLDANTILRLVGRPDMVREFSFLTMTTINPRSCCGQPARQINYTAIRNALAGMSPHRKELFRQMAGLR